MFCSVLIATSCRSITTESPSRAKAAARFTVVVVFPVPPFWLTTAKTYTIESGISASGTTTAYTGSSGMSDRRTISTTTVYEQQNCSPGAFFNLRASHTG